ncbi:MAG: DUF2868 domain-containing protein [Verrucomicrobia bacterium]|nr:DUF2868 domain-containing protein [Verrucomicrobiota bacterium]
MSEKWSIQELTELDIRLRSELPPASATPDTVPDAPRLPRPVLFRRWLEAVRKVDPSPANLARKAVRTERWLRLAAFAFFFIAGAAAAQALLLYDGRRLINVTAYLGTLVFGQLFLLVVLGVSGLLLRRTLCGPYRALLFHLTGPVEQSRALPLWSTRAFASMQTAGAGFNLGVLLATAAKGLTTDLAFGWATTLRIGGEQVHRLTSLLAAPWGNAFAPTPEQIEGSRIVLKEGLRHVETDAAAAWWPFLMMCVLFYGLLPRLFLALAGECRLRLQLRGLRFEDPSCERLHMRLTRSPLDFQSNAAADEALPPHETAGLPFLPKPKGSVRLQIPVEIAANVPEVAERLTAKLGVTVELPGDDLRPPPPGGIIRVCEVWQPPLRETLAELRQQRAELGADTDLILCFVGFPNPEELFDPPEPEDVRVWRNALAELNDPHLHAWVWVGQKTETL